MENAYYGQITPQIYSKALEVRGDDDCCWEERLVLSNPPLIFGKEFPEDALCDDIIGIWEAALAEAQEERGDDGFVLESVMLFLVEDSHSNEGELVWERNIKVRGV